MAKKGYLYQVKPLLKSVQRFLSVDPAAADYAAWSTYAYVLDNPNIFVDPNGKNHIFYLVVQEGANVDIDKVSELTQTMLDDNGINLKVHVITVGDEGFGDIDFKGMLDKTDALTFIGTESFVEGIVGDNIGYGYTDERVGYVNLDGAHDAVERGDFVSEHTARAAIHEGVGHDRLGSGHPDVAYPPGIHPSRYSKREGGGGYQVEQNIMTSGRGTKWSENPMENGGSKFLPEDKAIIQSKLPSATLHMLNNPLTGKKGFNISYDNFSKRLKE